MRGVDTAIVGLGVMGSAIARELARRGLAVVAFDRWWPAHDRGSSHGETRLFREVHFEHVDYVPLARSAHSGWRALEHEVGRQLFVNTGTLVTGPTEQGLVRRVRETAEAHRVPFEFLPNAALHERFPWLRVGKHNVGLLETSAGVLLADECVASLQRAAVEFGAELRFGTECELHVSSAGHVALTANGETIEAKQVVVAAGPWTSQVLPPEWIPPLVVERAVSFWFRPDLSAADFEASKIPAVVWDHPPQPTLFFPDICGRGIKVNVRQSDDVINASQLDRFVTPHEIAAARSQLEAAIAVGEFVGADACMFTSTRDQHFAIGPVDTSGKVLLVSACCGHGFKFAPVVGEIVAELLVDGSTRHPATLFRLDRSALYPESGFIDRLGTTPVRQPPHPASAGLRRRR